MFIGKRIRAIRESKSLTQADLEGRTALARTYISRIENGHLVPSVETFERIARGLGVPLYQLFCDQHQSPAVVTLPDGNSVGRGRSGRDTRMLLQFRTYISRMSKEDRQLLADVAVLLVRKRKTRS